MEAETLITTKGRVRIMCATATPTLVPTIPRRASPLKNATASTMLGTSMGNSKSQITARAVGPVRRLSPNAASGRVAVEQTALAVAAAMLVRVALRHAGWLKKTSYHCSEKPFGGKTMNSVLVNETGPTAK